MDNTKKTIECSDKRKKELAVAVCVGSVLIVAIIFLCIVAFNADINFSDKYSYHSDKDWFEVSDDNSYMKIDTNPHDLKGKTEYSAMFAVKSINEELGFPESLYEKMEETRALDGKQSEENKKIKVTWTYHPDEGLEVMYENK